MSDVIGRITVPAVVSSGTTFPLVSEMGYGVSRPYPVVAHQFGALDTKSEQRFQVGIGPRTFAFKRSNLSIYNRNTLAAFWEALQGPYSSFTYNVPNPDQTTTATTVIWEQAPLSFDYLIHACRVGLNFVELPTTNPSYTVASTCTRFPSSTLQTALLSEVQQIIPLVHIRVRESAVPDIYLSDRRCSVGGQQYIPRVMGLGEPGSDVILTQDISGSADNVRFAFGNADSVMTLLANDTDLKYATIDLCLYHVNTGILLQLWKGSIQDFTIDGSNAFTVLASDGIYQVAQQYPSRVLSRTCWKTYNDGLNCQWATAGASSAAVIAAGGDPASCDYYYNSTNGCLVHGMHNWFGGIPILPQSVSIKDNSTGFLGFDRNTVTATSIVSDTIWGKALADIYCNSHGNLANSYITNALIAAVRDNGDFFDVLGIIGAGPLGSFAVNGNAAGEFVTNADGFTYLLAPLADGNPAHGLRIASNGTSTSKNSAFGLRQVPGVDPVFPGEAGSYQFQLANIVGNNPPPLPQATGVAFAEVLYAKQSGITPSVADSHSMTVPLAQGLSGWTWDGTGGTITSRPGTGTAFNAGLSSPPANWYVPSFDDSTWGGIVLQTGGVIGAPPSGTQWVTNVAGPQPDACLVLFRIPFIASSLTNDITLFVAADNYVNAVYSNGTAVSYTSPPGSAYPGFAITIPAATLVTGTNILGIAILNGTVGFPNPVSLAYSASTGATRQWTDGLTNPFWITLNTYLKAQGLGNSVVDPSVQAATFVESSFFAGDGTGAAEIAATSVPRILGVGSETQFQFQGAIDTQKPLRDWLTEILNVGLGYYTFAFGQLKVGCRINASSVDAYTLANIKYQTLTLNPIQAQFERLIIDYADQAYQYQANVAEYQDKDHAAYYGRAGSPLTMRMHSLGSPTLSQTLRLAATRVREEIGGINSTEWRNARVASWQTTLLGLNNEVGQVVSITDATKIPGIRGVCNVDGSGHVTWVSGDAFDTSMLNKDVIIDGTTYAITGLTGSPVTSFTTTPSAAPGTAVAFRVITMDFRIQNWQLRKDWSIAMTAKTVTPSMYDLDVGPKPADVLPLPLPRMPYPLPSPVAWCPYQVQYASNDPVYAQEWTFDLQEGQVISADGRPLTRLVCTGKLPSNTYSIAAPYVGTISQSATGGSIPGGSLLRIVVSGLDANGYPTTPSDVMIVSVPAGTNTNTVTLSAITWPTVAGLTAYVVYASVSDDLICEQLTGALTPGLGSTYTPSSVTLTTLNRITWAVPNAATSQVILKAKTERHGGVIGAGVTSVSPNIIVASDIVDTSGGGFTPVGRVLSIIGRNGASVPAFNTVITGWTPSTGVLSCSPDPNGVVQPGDAFIIRFKGYDNSASPSQFTDTGILNITTSYSGFTVNAESGSILRVIAGKGRGQKRKLTSNTTTALVWDEPLYLDTTSLVIVENASWEYTSEGTQVSNANPNISTALSIPAGNLLDDVLLVAGFTINSDGVESDDADQQVREIWMYGSQATRIINSDTTVLPTDGTIQVDSSTGPVTLTFPAPGTMLNQTVLIQKLSSDTNNVTVNTPSGTAILLVQWSYLIVRASI